MKNKTFSEPLPFGSSGENPSKKTARKKLKWHPAFIQAMQLELFDYKDSLEFKQEYQLTSEPLRIDLLIIKKPKELVIDKNIARIFRTDNIIEYKSPEDYLSIKDFLKVYAYANLYAAITTGVDPAEITLTFIESRQPRKLLNYLESVRDYKVAETSPGIYSVSGDYLPIQIVVSKKLPESENLWLNSLRNDLKERNFNTIMDRRDKLAEKSSVDAYIDIVIKANREIMEANGMSLQDTLVEIMEEKGLNAKWMEQGRDKGREEAMTTIARNLLSKGSSPEFVQEITGLSLDQIAKL